MVDTGLEVQEVVLPRELSPIKPYFSLPQEDRTVFLEGLKLDTQGIPTQDEMYGKKGGKFSSFDIEDRYAEATEKFALRLDPNYREGSSRNDPEVVKKKQEFYKLIRPLIKEQIIHAVNFIETPEATKAT